MTKSELRKARKAAHAAGQSLNGELALDRSNGPVEYSSERLANGRINLRRAAALERNARRVYEDDRQ